MADLIAKIRAARETVVEVGGFDFTIRRPTELEMMELQASDHIRGAICHVAGWSKVKESDVLPNGDPEPLEFNADICKEWLADRADLLLPIVKAVFASFRQHAERREAAAKNSSPGSSAPG